MKYDSTAHMTIAPITAYFISSLVFGSLYFSQILLVLNQIQIVVHFTFTFTFMHLADAFIQSDLHCIQVSTFYQLLLSLGIEPMILALLAPCSTS